MTNEEANIFFAAKHFPENVFFQINDRHSDLNNLKLCTKIIYQERQLEMLMFEVHARS